MREREPREKRWGAGAWGPPALAILSDGGCGAGAQKWVSAETLPQRSEWGKGRKGGAKIYPPGAFSLLLPTGQRSLGRPLHALPGWVPWPLSRVQDGGLSSTRDVSLGSRSGGRSRHFLCDWWAGWGDREEGEVQAHTGQVPVNSQVWQHRQVQAHTGQGCVNSCLQDLSLVTNPSLNFENRKHLALICLAISAEPHTHSSGCPANVLFYMFHGNCRWNVKIIVSYFQTLFLPGFPVGLWPGLKPQLSILYHYPFNYFWSSMVTVIFHSQGCCSGHLSSEDSNRLLNGLLSSIFSLSDPSYYCWQTVFLKISL